LFTFTTKTKTIKNPPKEGQNIAADYAALSPCLVNC